MTLYLIPHRNQPVTLDDLRRVFSSIAWTNSDAGGPDEGALSLVGGTIAPPVPPYDPAIENIVWDAGEWNVIPILFDEGGAGSMGSSSGAMLT